MASGQFRAMPIRAGQIGTPESVFLSDIGLVVAHDAREAVVFGGVFVDLVDHAGNAADDRFAFRRRQDGGYSLAPGAMGVQ